METMAAGILNMTLMTGFRFMIMNIVATRFAKKLLTHKYQLSSRDGVERMTYATTK